MSTQISIMFICMTLAVSLVPRDAEAIVWESVQEISIDAATEDQWYPMIVADGDKAHVVWYDAPGGDYDVIYRVFDGTTWGAQWEVNTDVGHEEQFNPSIAVYGDKKHVVWYEWPGLAGGWPDVYHRYYDGTTWWNDGPIAIDVGTMFDRSPSIAAYQDKAHVVWQDYTDGDADIYYSYFNGIGWVNTQELSTDVSAEWQLFASIGVDADEVHVVWQDEGDGDSDIYHRYYNGT
ncbi:MAG: hypothetical protein KAW09_08795, partial [Thermoplasmata archaeon]|nr:hypothetical protein [Thermoplasmata archaeon]